MQINLTLWCQEIGTNRHGKKYWNLRYDLFQDKKKRADIEESREGREQRVKRAESEESRE